MALSKKMKETPAGLWSLWIRKIPETARAVIRKYLISKFAKI
jgi:hypothetical protein